MTTADGRIGETPAECAKRYGKPKKFSNNVGYYSKDGFRLSICLANEKAVDVVYFRHDLEPWTTAQFFAILKLNSDEAWMPAKPDIGWTKWINRSAGMLGGLTTGRDRVRLATIDAVKAEHDRQNAEDVATLKGL